MKEDFKAILSFLAAAAVVIAICLARPLFYRLYPGDRISGTLSVYCDNERYDLNAENTKCYYGDTERPITFGLLNAKPSVSVKGGEPGGYVISVIPTDGALSGKEVRVIVPLINSWDVINFDCYINISVDEDGKLISNTTATYTDISTDGSKQERHLDIQSEDSDIVRVTIK